MLKLLLVIGVLFGLKDLSYTQHPNLCLTQEGVEAIRIGLGTVPVFDKVFEEVKNEVNGVLELGGVEVPTPKDMAGGYTHEQHKFIYKILQKSGNLYQITKEEKYAKFIKETLFKYASLYPTLKLHPSRKSYATGKLFWQCLNDANWLVFVSEAYDCIYNYLDVEERRHLEENLFIPFADFLSIKNPKFFNRIHNHSTWANAAVGMIALVMGNDTLLNKALYGMTLNAINLSDVDNDGGFIRKKGQERAGFLAQLDFSFSPDGYFAEGPYYQRYAIFPFLKFGQALRNHLPELEIFEHRDGILKKATTTLLQLTDKRGNFFPINDAQKGMSIESYELVMAVNLIYFIDQDLSDLCNWAALQQTVSFDEAGYFMALALRDINSQKPEKTSAIYRDGIGGDEGGVAVLRSAELEMLFKFSTQGMGHGHFDRLSYSLYNEGDEVLQDYGAVRWVNIEQKEGGRYLKENQTFGKQSIAHNTAVLNRSSHFNGYLNNAEKSAPYHFFSKLGEGEFQIVSAVENEAYPNTRMHRFLIFISDEDLLEPAFIDVMNIQSDDLVSIDLPMWYMGQIMKSNLNCTKNLNELNPIGKAQGYQHIWKEAQCEIDTEVIHFNWLSADKFYTLHSTSRIGDTVVYGRLGANDPSFNLRNDPVLIHRRYNVSNSNFVNLIETHGRYHRVRETPINAFGQIEEIKLIFESDSYVVFDFSTSNYTYRISLSLLDNDIERKHVVNHKFGSTTWKGVYNFQKFKK